MIDSAPEACAGRPAAECYREAVTDLEHTSLVNTRLSCEATGKSVGRVGDPFVDRLASEPQFSAAGATIQ